MVPERPHAHAWVRAHDGYGRGTGRVFCTGCPVGGSILGEGPGDLFSVVPDDWKPEPDPRLVMPYKGAV